MTDVANLKMQLEYQTLKAHAEAGAKRLLSLNLKKGDRVALIAETSSGFVEAFFACQYAGLVAVPLAIPMGVGQRDSWSAKLQGLLASCQPAAIITGDEWLPLVNAATHDNPELHVLSHAWFKALPEADVALQRPSSRRYRLPPVHLRQHPFSPWRHHYSSRSDGKSTCHQPRRH